MRRLPASEVADIRSRVPVTHEIGGTIEFTKDGRFLKTNIVNGERCRDASGRLLRASGVCRLQHQDGSVAWHSHPLANRPSSSDLVVSVHQDVRFDSSRNVRESNVLFTPRGIWVYRPSQELCSRWTGLDEDAEKASLRFLGHFHQPATQNGDCQGFVEALRREGFEVDYCSYDEIPPDGVIGV